MRSFYIIPAILTVSLCGQTGFAGSKRSKSVGFFVSIDGLQPDHLKLAAESDWLPASKGLGWMYRNSAVSLDADPAFTTLTAASHVSTITCSSPAIHGITSNSLMRGGEKLSGFTAPVFAETLWQAAKRQGKTVASIAYVGADGQSPERTADVGIAYPDSKLIAPGREVAITVTELGQQSLDVVLNPTTKETARIYATVQDHEGEKLVVFDTDENLANGTAGYLNAKDQSFQALNLYFTETDPNSPTLGFKRRVIATKILAAEDKLVVYLSGASYNNAYPRAFGKALEDRNLVWPDYEIRPSARPFNYAETVEAASQADKFSTAAAKLAAEKFPTDVVLFYQPLLDSYGHKYQREIVDALAAPNPSQAAVIQGYRKAFALIDANLSELFSLRQDPTVALMGDHGMEAIRQTINLGALEGVDAQLPFVVSGALALLYPNDPSAPMAAGEKVAAALEREIQAGTLKMSGIYRRDQADLAPGGEWPYGEAVWAFLGGAGSGMTYNPINRQLILPPSISGNHGHGLALRSMRTALLIHDARVRPQSLGHQSLLNAVPTFVELLGFSPPANCQGQAINLKGR